MTDTQTMLSIAQASSAITSFIGLVVLVYIVRVLKHLVKDNFRKVFSLMGAFFLVALIGVVSMTLYHFLDGVGYSELEGNVDLLWYIFMFISIPVSIYGSYVIINFGNSMRRMEEVVSRNANRVKSPKRSKK